MAWNRHLGEITLEELPGVLKVATTGEPQISAKERPTVAMTLEICKKGVEVFGGKCVVDVGAHVRILGGDNVDELQGKRQTSITLTFTVIE